MGYTKDSIDRVRDAVDMVELVGARSELRRRGGGNFTGLCPFHDERTPSFSVNADKKVYYCFGCQESGDAIDFVKATEGLEFREAVEALAERYNVELKREDEDPQAEARRQRRQRLLELVERATAYYERVLWESKEAARARAYLAERGLGDEVLRTFRVGYAPSAWDSVMMAAQRLGFSREELAAAGLGQQGRGGGFYDRFRGRIMFPLADPRGKVLGFGARAMRDDQGPKYVNTSENELYHKGRQLFGIDHARGPAARVGRVVAVEGYTDVLALHQAGVTESVAIMGTALTQEQMAGLAQAAGVGGTVCLGLDADRAGQEAMLRAAKAAKEKKLELLVVDMPEGADPADLIAADGADAFRERLAAAREVPDFAARRIIAQADLHRPGGRDDALNAVRPWIAQLASKPATRDELVRYLSDRLDVPPNNLLAQLETPVAPAAQTAAPPRVLRLDATARLERSFLTMCVSSEELGREYLERLSDDHFSSAPLRRVREHLSRHWDDPLADLPEEDPMLSALIKDVVMRADETHVSDDVLRLDFLQLELRRAERRLRRAEQDGDFEAQRALAPERQGLKAQIDELMGATA